MTEAGEILRELRDIKDRLYDKDGDVPAIREHLAKQNDKIDKNTNRSNKNRLLIYALIAFLAGSSGVSIWGIVTLAG